MSENNGDKPESPQQLTREEQELLQELQKKGVENEADVGETKAEEVKYDYYHSNHYDIDPKVGLVYKKREVISTQRNLVFTLLKQAGSNLLHGKSIMNATFPIAVFEPYSTLDRVASLCCYAPAMLSSLSEVADAVERMKRVMAWAVATLHLGISQEKPFNSTLGETLEAKVGDLTFYGEHTRHQPPTILVTGKDFRMYGNYEIIAYTHPNTANVVIQGTQTVEFSGPNPASYTIVHPDVEISGLMMGSRVYRYKGALSVTDKTKGLFGQIRMNPNKRGFFASIFSKQAYRDDHIKGFITKNRALLSVMKNSVFESKDVISTCEGNWIETLAFDGKTYWEMGKIVPAVIVPVEDPLPSDTSLRPDIQALKRGEFVEATRLKEMVEQRERTDEKLREAAKKKLTKLKKSH